jgi:hypothetical protein
LVLAGCAGRVPAETIGDLPSAKNIVTLDCTAHGAVAIQAKRSATLADGRLKVELEIANVTSPAHAVTIQVRARFLDAQGMLTGDETPFETILVAANTSVRYAATSAKTAVADYVVEIRTTPLTKDQK